MTCHLHAKGPLKFACLCLPRAKDCAPRGATCLSRTCCRSPNGCQKPRRVFNLTCYTHTSLWVIPMPWYVTYPHHPTRFLPALPLHVTQKHGRRLRCGRPFHHSASDENICNLFCKTGCRGGTTLPECVCSTPIFRAAEVYQHIGHWTDTNALAFRVSRSVIWCCLWCVCTHANISYKDKLLWYTCILDLVVYIRIRTNNIQT